MKTVSLALEKYDVFIFLLIVFKLPSLILTGGGRLGAVVMVSALGVRIKDSINHKLHHYKLLGYCMHCNRAIDRTPHRAG